MAAALIILGALLIIVGIGLLSIPWAITVLGVLIFLEGVDLSRDVKPPKPTEAES